MTSTIHEDLLRKRKAEFPAVLIYGEKYKKVSSDAKIAYIILFNSLNKAREENWRDDKGHLFFKFNYGELSNLFNWPLKKTKIALYELEIENMIEIVSDPSFGVIQRLYLVTP
ncbi:replication initiator protein A [Weissella paramesenteroides]|uniref:replication initiator protein A n=1 Tax=Lactobacillaceae TaxID=33958 RepID=UPI000933D3EE|nr:MULTISPECIES: replication initiator protein A [Lactobacillaceae]MCD5258225.1 replication initiator protein A [Pediococcus pentosaceus]